MICGPDTPHQVSGSIFMRFFLLPDIFFASLMKKTDIARPLPVVTLYAIIAFNPEAPEKNNGR